MFRWEWSLGCVEVRERTLQVEIIEAGEGSKSQIMKGLAYNTDQL